MMMPRFALKLVPAVLALWAGMALSDGVKAQDAAPALTATAAPQSGPESGQVRRHAVSLIGEPKFKSDFKHFDWVNPDAPKGGVLRMKAEGTFDNLNTFTIKGVEADGLALLNDTLMRASLDEPSAEYGLVAEWISFPPDYSTATFGLRPQAKFHDGAPMTPDDVVFSFDAITKVNPFYAKYFKNVVKVEKSGEHEVTFTFDKPGNRELPQILGGLPVLPKHYWTAKGANGEPRDLAKTTLEPPLDHPPSPRVEGSALTAECLQAPEATCHPPTCTDADRPGCLDR